ncbi:MAG: MotA/TolQ/ExbB proton channel family protein [Campylobacterota bacterium]|nr:MotA/TolQ/ExbB proton channel family protein [Campylobacterota bacterium]
MGGFVMPALVGVTFLLWFGLASRFLNLVSTTKDPRTLIRHATNNQYHHGVMGDAVKKACELSKEIDSKKKLRANIDEDFRAIKTKLNQHKTMIMSLVAIAPLLGLLGTVDGMIETFDSLGDMALFSSTGGIAGGISKALFTTQMGLVISIPGLIMGRILDKKQANMVRELDQVIDLVCAKKEN